MWIVLIFVAVAALAGVYAIVCYNSFVAMRNNVDKAWSNIDVLLKQRFDELPKLVKVCEGYMQHERQTLEAVIEARSRISSARGEAAQRTAQNQLSETLKSLFMVVEQYPELKADRAFANLAARISGLEEQIADRREFFNDTVTLYNTRREQFPDVVIASLFAFTARELWRIDPAHRRDVEIDFKRG